MTTIDHFANECFIALQDAGMISDGVTDTAYADWKAEAKAIIRRFIEDAIADAKKVEP